MLQGTNAAPASRYAPKPCPKVYETDCNMHVLLVMITTKKVSENLTRGHRMFMILRTRMCTKCSFLRNPMEIEPLLMTYQENSQAKKLLQKGTRRSLALLCYCHGHTQILEIQAHGGERTSSASSSISSKGPTSCLII